jgi:hypothetical protein
MTPNGESVIVSIPPSALQISPNLARHGPVNIFLHKGMYISGTKIMKGVMQVSGIREKF